MRGKASSLASAIRIGSVDAARLVRAPAVYSQEDLLVGVEIRVDGIERHDGGEQRRFSGPARDEVALGDDRAADPAADRGDHLRELEIQLRGPERSFHGRRLRHGLLRKGGAAIVLLARDRVLGAKPLGALQFRVGALARGSRTGELGAQAIDFRLERARIDLEQQVASPNDGALFETYRRDETGHARPHFDGIDGLQTAGELVPLGHVALDDLGDGDLWRRWWTLLRRCL